MYLGWSSGMPTMAREAAGNMLLWSRGTSGVWPLLSRASHVSMVINALSITCIHGPLLWSSQTDFAVQDGLLLRQLDCHY